MTSDNGNDNAEGEAGAPARPPTRVLLVEDSRNVQSALLDLLGEIGGFEVVGRAIGETEATDWMYHHPAGWDLAIVDLVLENGSGFTLFQRLLREHPRSQALVYSEFASPALKQKCLALGAAAVFRKSELASFVAWLEEARSG